jgi:hypothetical protein
MPTQEHFFNVMDKLKGGQSKTKKNSSQNSIVNIALPIKIAIFIDGGFL